MSQEEKVQRTIGQWFEMLPDGYRQRALFNTPDAVLRENVDSMADAISGAFTWYASPEGSRFWEGVADYYSPRSLPPLPLEDPDDLLSKLRVALE